jgi:hypothetical protein
VLAPDLDRVAKAARGDQRGPGALALDQGVGEQRGAVHHVRDRLGRYVGLAQHFHDAALDGGVRLLGRGQDLGDAQQRARLVDHDEVGEGAADVRPDPMAHVLTPR